MIFPFFCYRMGRFWWNKTRLNTESGARRVLCITILPGESLSRRAGFMKQALWCCYLQRHCCMHKSLSPLSQDYSRRRVTRLSLTGERVCACVCVTMHKHCRDPYFFYSTHPITYLSSEIGLLWLFIKWITLGFSNVVSPSLHHQLWAH